jgi:uncharacterized protein (TIGR00661 family)
MNILYGVQTTGRGHIFRSKEIISSLKDKGHHLFVILSGRGSELAFEEKIFSPGKYYKGLTFITENGKVKYLKTGKHLGMRKFYRDISEFDPSGYDLVITDFEPISARIAWRNHITSLGIGRQYAFMQNIPKAKGYLLSRFIIRYFAPVDIPVGLHWSHFNQNILPPIIKGDLIGDREVIDNKILVYLPFEEDRLVIDELSRVTKKYNFFVYLKTDEEKNYGRNVFLRKYSRENFINDLKECNGVICNSGFSLLSEALHLGKPILTKPLMTQIEQESNALAIRELGLGSVMEQLSFKDIEKWLSNRKPITPMKFPNVVDPLADWIDSGMKQDISSMVGEIWDSK